MLIQLFRLPVPLEYNGELLKNEWSGEGRVFVIKLGDNGKHEVSLKMTREEAVEVQKSLNLWNPITDSWEHREVNRLKLELVELDGQNTHLEELLDEANKDWLELSEENEKLKARVAELAGGNNDNPTV